MPALARHHYFTEAQYLLLERQRRDKTEYYQGTVYCMAGGSPRHNRLSSRFHFSLNLRLDGKPCQPSSADQQIATPDGLLTYPDLAVICGRIELRPNTTDVATNPTLLVEVLSPSTREYDLGDKLGFYKKIPTLQAVLFAEPDEAKLLLVHRTGAGWRKSEFSGLDAVAPIHCLGIELPLAELYKGLVGPEGPLPI
jgi:Uma2 family endonuclease